MLAKWLNIFSKKELNNYFNNPIPSFISSREGLGLIDLTTTRCSNKNLKLSAIAKSLMDSKGYSGVV